MMFSRQQIMNAMHECEAPDYVFKSMLVAMDCMEASAPVAVHLLRNALAALMKCKSGEYCDAYPAALKLAQDAMQLTDYAQQQVATVTECEACFTPDVCQLRGTCDHYTAAQLRIAKAAP